MTETANPIKTHFAKLNDLLIEAEETFNNMKNFDDKMEYGEKVLYPLRKYVNNSKA